MTTVSLRRVLFLLLLISTVGISQATAQIFSAPSAGGKFAGSMVNVDSIGAGQMNSNRFLINSHKENGSPLGTASGSVSKLDLKAPGKARSEYKKGYQLLMGKKLDDAVVHLANSIAIYPSFVAAHNALGTAYLEQGHKEQALNEFNKAIALDDHLPNSYLNRSAATPALGSDY